MPFDTIEKSTDLQLVARIQVKPLCLAVSQVIKTCLTKGQIPILAGIRFSKQHDGLLKLEGTDLDMTTILSIPALEVGPESVVVAAKPLLALLKALPDYEVVTLRVNEDARPWVLLTRQDGAQMPLEGHEPSDFPSFDLVRGISQSFNIKGSAFAAMLKSALHSISTEHTRYCLNGVFITCDAVTKALHMVSTDSHRLTLLQEPDILLHDMETMRNRGVIVPTPIVKILAQVFAKTHENVNVTLTQDRVYFTQGNILIASKIINGSFPQYERIIPEKGRERVVFMASGMLSGLKTLTAGRDKECPVKLETFVDGTIAITTADDNPPSTTLMQNTGAQIESVDGYNSAYIKQMLEVAPSDVILMTPNVQGAPARFDDGSGRTVVIMPRRL